MSAKESVPPLTAIFGVKESNNLFQSQTQVRSLILSIMPPKAHYRVINIHWPTFKISQTDFAAAEKFNVISNILRLDEFRVESAQC